MLAGQEDIKFKRFVMCNKDQAICVSVKEPKPEEIAPKATVLVKNP